MNANKIRQNEKKLVTDASTLKNAASLLREIADALDETANSNDSFTRVCGRRDLNALQVRNLLLRKTLQNCIVPNMTELKNLDTSSILQLDSYEQFYKNVFGDIFGANVVLPWDYKETVKYFLDELNDKERKVLEYRLGIGDDVEIPMTYEQISKKMGLGKNSPSEIEAKVYKRMRYRCNIEILKIGITEHLHREIMKAIEGKQTEEQRNSCVLEESENLQKIRLENAFTDDDKEIIDFLNTSIREVETTSRMQGCFWRAGIHTVRDLLSYEVLDLHRVPGLGHKSFNEAIAVIQKLQEQLDDLCRKKEAANG